MGYHWDSIGRNRWFVACGCAKLDRVFASDIRSGLLGMPEFDSRQAISGIYLCADWWEFVCVRGEDMLSKEILKRRTVFSFGDAPRQKILTQQ